MTTNSTINEQKTNHYKHDYVKMNEIYDEIKILHNHIEKFLNGSENLDGLQNHINHIDHMINDQKI